MKNTFLLLLILFTHATKLKADSAKHVKPLFVSRHELYRWHNPFPWLPKKAILVTGSFGPAVLYGDLHPQFKSGRQYLPVDFIPNLSRHGSMGLEWIYYRQKRLSFSVSAKVSAMKLYASDEGTHFAKTGMRNLTTEVGIRSVELMAHTHYHFAPNWKFSLGLGYGRGRATPEITGSKYMLNKFFRQIKNEPVNYGHGTVEAGIFREIWLPVKTKTPVHVAEIGVSMNSTFRASDGIDGYVYHGPNDIGRGFDSYVRPTLTIKANLFNFAGGIRNGAFKQKGIDCPIWLLQ